MRLIGRKDIFLIATLGLLSLMFALAWLGNVPYVDAQAPTHVFKGKVSVDGQPVSDGTPLRIFVDEKRISEADTKVTGGQYEFRIAQPQGQSFRGKLVVFAIQTREGRRWFPQTSEWQPGGETTVLLRDPGPVGTQLDYLRPKWADRFFGSVPGKPVTQPPVHVFNGRVAVDGQPASDGTPLRIFVDGQRISEVDTRLTGGQFVFRVAQTQGQSFRGNIVVFAMQTREGRRWFPQTVEWQPGGKTAVVLRDPLPVGVGRDLLGPLPVQNTPQAEARLFRLNVNLDGRAVPDGTLVMAFIDGVLVTSVETNDGRIELRVPPWDYTPGKTVAFVGRTVDGRELRFPQTGVWMLGGYTTVNLHLENTSSFPAAEEMAVHVFQGPIILDGRPVQDETTVVALIGEVRVAGSRTVAGSYRLEVRQPLSMTGRTVEFSGWMVGDTGSTRPGCGCRGAKLPSA